MKWFSLIILMIGSMGCNRSNEDIILKKLEEKYHQKFALEYDEYSKVRDSFNYSAYPISNPDLKFSGQHDEEFTWITDSYKAIYVSDQFRYLLSEELTKNGVEGKLYAAIGLENDRIEYYFENWDSFSLDALSNESSVSIKFYLNTIGELTEENRSERLGLLNQLFSKLAKSPWGVIRCDIRFLSESIPLKSSELPDPFETPGEIDPVYVKQRLNLYFNSKDCNRAISIQDLFELVTEVTPEAYSKTNKLKVVK